MIPMTAYETRASAAEILIVDDRPDNLRVLAEILKDQGYTVRILREADMVMPAVVTAPPDLMLLDIMMPGLSGFEICVHLKADKRTCHIPILFLSAMDNVDDKLKGFAVGGDDYITKPFRTQEVAARVEKHLTIGRLRRQLEERNAELEREISERRHVERALRDSETQFRTMFEQHSAVMLLIDPDTGCIIRANKAAEWYYDYTAAEFQKLTIYQLTELSVEETQREMAAAKAQKRIYFHFRHRLASGNLRNVEVYSSPILFQGRTLLFSIIHDITDRQEIETALRENEDMFRSVVEQANDGIVLTNPQGRIIAWNRAQEAMTGVRRADVIGQPIWDVQSRLARTQSQQDPQANTQRLRQVTEHALQTGQAPWFGQLLEHEITHANGEHRFVQTTTFPIQTRQGVLLGSVIRDITERKQVEQELHHAKETADAARISAEEARKIAEAANQAKSLFLAHMSHELRTPLNGILGYAQLLKRAKNLTEAQMDGLEVIEHSGQHLLNLINDILDLSKIEAQKMELQETEVCLPDMLKDVSELIRIRTQEAGIDFQFTLPPTLPEFVRVDEKHLRQVLLNLLSNAVKFTKQGTVTLRILDLGFEILDLKNPHQSISNQKSQIKNLKFEVSDTGIGIPAEHLESIFSPFTQILDHARKTEGTGLGLSISRKLVRLMGSELQISSVVGQGSTFWFDLRVPEVSGPGLLDQKKFRNITGIEGWIHGTGQACPKILVIDDDVQNQALIDEFLTPLGFEVYAATSGRMGIERVLEGQPHLILVELTLPDLDGFETIRRIRALEVSPATLRFFDKLKTSQAEDSASLRSYRVVSGVEPSVIPFPIMIGISTRTFEADRRRSLEAGCNAFLPKPLEISAMLRLLERYFGITWRYDEAQALPAHAPGPAEAPLFVVPSREDLDRLLQLATVGDIRAISQSLDALTQRQPELHPFAAQVAHFMKGFRIDEIRELLKALHSKGPYVAQNSLNC